MERSSLSAAISAALPHESPYEVADLAESRAAQPHPPGLITNHGAVDACDYEPLLRVTALANLWQVVRIAHAAWEAAPDTRRPEIDAALHKHLSHSAELYEQACRGVHPGPHLSQQEMLDHDVASHGLEETLRVAAPEGDGASNDTDAVLARLNGRIDRLQRELSQDLTGIDWRGPALASHLPVFHLQFGVERLELHFSLGGRHV